MAQLPLKLPLDQMQTKWKSILDPIISENSTFIGEMRIALLTTEQFQAQSGINWVPMDGRNVNGSAFQKLTGQSTVPNMSGVLTHGNFFIRIN